MNRRHGGFWIGFTAVLTVLFTALFFPTVYGRLTLTESLASTGAGIFVIWAVYFVRAAIFTRLFSQQKPPSDGRDLV